MKYIDKKYDLLTSRDGSLFGEFSIGSLSLINLHGDVEYFDTIIVKNVIDVQETQIWHWYGKYNANGNQKNESN